MRSDSYPAAVVPHSLGWGLNHQPKFSRRAASAQGNT